MRRWPRRAQDVPDLLLRSSFRAGGQPAPAQIGGRSWYPWLTAGDRSFPPLLARLWHGLPVIARRLFEEEKCR